MANKIAQLVIELAANSARLQTDMAKAVGIAERGAAQIKKAFTFITAGAGALSGGLIGAALIGAAKNAIKFGDDLNKAAIKAGIGTKAMSELAYAAKLADVDLGSLSVALKKMQVAISEAGTGSKQAQGAFAALGLTVEQIQKRKPEAQFELIADRISKLADPADKARAATELFGKAGADLLPLFEQGAAGIAKATAEARKLGLAFDDKDISSLSAADDSVKRLTASWEGFAATMTAKVAPALSDVLDRMVGVDTRSADVQVASISKTLANMKGLIGPEFEQQRKELQDRLSRAQLQVAIDQQSRLGTGTFGGPSSRTNDGTAIGFARADAAEKAAATAKKAAEANEKEMRKFLDGYQDAVLDMNATVDKDADAALKNEMDRWMERQDAANEFYDEYLKREKEAQVLREQNALKTAAFFKDTILSAFDDMVNGTKIKWSEMLKYLALQTARAGLAKLLDNAFAVKSSSSSSNKSGFWSAAADFVGSLFGNSNASSIDGKASGGPVSAGRTYLVGERGMELFRPSQNGSIVPNHALAGGGAVTVAPVYHINNPDNTERLPAILAENNRRLVDSLSRAGLLRD